MRAWAVWFIILFALLLLAFLKIGIFIAYCHEDFKVRLVIGPLKFQLNKREKQKAERKGTKPLKKGAKKAPGRSVKPWLRAAVENWQDLLALIARVLTAPTLDVLSLKINVGGSEPDKCAIEYGRICSIVGGMLAPLENTFDIKRRSIEIQCRFDKDSIEIDAEAAISLKIYEIIILAAALLKMMIKLYRQAKLI